MKRRLTRQGAAEVKRAREAHPLARSEGDALAVGAYFYARLDRLGGDVEAAYAATDAVYGATYNDINADVTKGAVCAALQRRDFRCVASLIAIARARRFTRIGGLAAEYITARCLHDTEAAHFLLRNDLAPVDAFDFHEVGYLPRAVMAEWIWRMRDTGVMRPRHWGSLFGFSVFASHTDAFMTDQYRRRMRNVLDAVSDANAMRTFLNVIVSAEGRAFRFDEARTLREVLAREPDLATSYLSPFSCIAFGRGASPIEHAEQTLLAAELIRCGVKLRHWQVVRALVCANCEYELMRARGFFAPRLCGECAKLPAEGASDASVAPEATQAAVELLLKRLPSRKVKLA